MELDNMYFVYSLLIEEHVFYIGKCKNLAARYAAHISKAQRGGYEDHATTAFIRKLLLAGKCPLIKGIEYLPSNEAVILERHLIQIFTQAGHKLTNSNGVCKFTADWHHHDFPHTLKNVRKHARYHQGVKEYYALFWKNPELAEKHSFPTHPFKNEQARSNR